MEANSLSNSPTEAQRINNLGSLAINNLLHDENHESHALPLVTDRTSSNPPASHSSAAVSSSAPSLEAAANASAFAPFDHHSLSPSPLEQILVAAVTSGTAASPSPPPITEKAEDDRESKHVSKVSMTSAPRYGVHVTAVHPSVSRQIIAQVGAAPAAGFQGDPLNIADKGDTHRYELGLHSKARYYVRHPWHFVRVPFNQAVIAWDNLRHHPGGDQHEPDRLHPSLFARITTLIFLFTVTFGSSITYASVGAVSDMIKEEYGLSESQYSLLFSIYSLPNIVATFFGGLIVDRIGPNFAMGLYCTLLFVGNAVTLIPNYAGLLVGRALYGLGDASLAVVSASLLARWYTKDPIITLSFASSICLISYRISGFLALAVLPPIANAGGLSWAFGFCTLMAGLSSVSGLVVVGFDKYYSPFLHDATADTKPPPTPHGAASTNGKPAIKEESSGFSWRHLMHLGTEFWLMSLLVFVYYAAVLTFIAFSVDFMQERFDISDSEASTNTSYIYLAAAAALPPCGALIDKLGHRMTITVFSSVIVVVGYLILLYTSVSPAVGCVLLGVSYSLTPAAVWPAIALVVEPALQGSAYGLVSSICNLATFVYPLALSPLKSSQDSSKPVILVLMITGIVCTLTALAMHFIDLAYGGVLEHTVVKKADTKLNTGKVPPAVEAGTQLAEISTHLSVNATGVVTGPQAPALATQPQGPLAA